ncbi:hypothetical protein [Prochlorococcus sp. MIT 1341]|uniref:hypothetical protein n=1 Tax=Prochlorococcus sp. MIT 1341 TaxID=3096221 RepID=UPI002A7498CE|nr:hypothetical protein [Prochlorococcus sp. MIT 1341]
MVKTNWLSGYKLSKELGINQETLKRWAELGFLQKGTHWKRISHIDNEILSNETPPEKGEIIYHLNWCKEQMRAWKSRDAKIPDIAA